MTISQKLLNSLEPSMRRSVEKLPEQQKQSFEDKYYNMYKDPLIAFILSIFSVQHLYFRQFGKFILFALSYFIIIGFFWWIYNIVVTYSKTMKINNKNAKKINFDIKLLQD